MKSKLAAVVFVVYLNLLLVSACGKGTHSGVSGAGAAVCSFSPGVGNISSCFYGDYCVESRLGGLNDTAEKARHGCETGYREHPAGRFAAGPCPAQDLVASCMYANKVPASAEEAGAIAIVRNYRKNADSTQALRQALKTECESAPGEFTQATFCTAD